DRQGGRSLRRSNCLLKASDLGAVGHAAVGQRWAIAPRSNCLLEASDRRSGRPHCGRPKVVDRSAIELPARGFRRAERSATLAVGYATPPQTAAARWLAAGYHR